MKRPVIDYKRPTLYSKQEAAPEAALFEPKRISCIEASSIAHQ
jgi:hypothetical protein